MNNKIYLIANKFNNDNKNKKNNKTNKNILLYR